MINVILSSCAYRNLKYVRCAFFFFLHNCHPHFTELDNTVGDIMLRINKRESYIILKLVKYITKHSASILSAIRLCAELDM